MDNGLPESLYSICKHTKSDLHIYVNVLDGGNARINSFFEKIKNFFKSKIDINYSIFCPDFSVFTKEQLEFDFANNKAKSAWSSAGLGTDLLWKLILTSISIQTLPVDKIASVGADTIFLDDIAKAYNQLDIYSDILLAGPRDAGTFDYETVQTTNPDIDREHYITADFCIWNNKKCKKSSNHIKMADDLVNNVKIRKFFDQDTQNIVINNDQKKILNQKWNVVPYFFNEINIPISEISMLHYASGVKPYILARERKYASLLTRIKSTKIARLFGKIMKLHRLWVPYFFRFYDQIHKEIIKNDLILKGS